MVRKEGKIKDIMTRNLVTASIDNSFKEVVGLFEANTFHHLPIVDDQGIVKGIISKSDFIKITYQISVNTGGSIYSQKFYDSLSAKDLMTPSPVTLLPDDDITLAADLFLENVYHAIPIVEDDQLLGIVTMHDLLSFAFYEAPVTDTLK